MVQVGEGRVSSHSDDHPTYESLSVDFHLLTTTQGHQVKSRSRTSTIGPGGRGAAGGMLSVCRLGGRRAAGDKGRPGTYAYLDTSLSSGTESEGLTLAPELSGCGGRRRGAARPDVPC